MAEETKELGEVSRLRQSFEENQTIQVCREAVLELQKPEGDSTKISSCVDQLGDLYVGEEVLISEILFTVIHGIDRDTATLGESVAELETKRATVLESREQASTSYDTVLRDDLEELHRSYEESPNTMTFDPDSFFWHYYEGRAHEDIGCASGEFLSDLGLSLEEENLYLKQEKYNCGVIQERRRRILDQLRNLKFPVFFSEETKTRPFASFANFDLRPALHSDFGVFLRPGRILLGSQHSVGAKMFLGDRWRFVVHVGGGVVLSGTNRTINEDASSILFSSGAFFTFEGGAVSPNDIGLSLDLDITRVVTARLSPYYEVVSEDDIAENVFFDATLVLNLKGFRLFAGVGTRGLHVGVGVEQHFDVKTAIEKSRKRP